MLDSRSLRRIFGGSSYRINARTHDQLTGTMHLRVEWLRMAKAHCLA